MLRMASIFTLVLTTATFAGDISTPGKTQPPPPDASATTQEDIQTGYEIQDSVADIALNLLQTMMSVF
jgi:hypothetical protein